MITVSQPESSAAEAYRSLRSTIMFTDSRTHHLGHGDSALNGSAVDTTRGRRSSSWRARALRRGRPPPSSTWRRVSPTSVSAFWCSTATSADQTPTSISGSARASGCRTCSPRTATVDLSQHVRQSDIPGVEIITAGTQLERPSALPARMGDLVTQARELADIVLIDSAPMLLANDAMDLMPYVDTVLVVSYSGRATSEHAHRASELLARTRAPVIGVALVGVKGRSYQDLMSYSHGTREDLIAMEGRSGHLWNDRATPATPAPSRNGTS